MNRSCPPKPQGHRSTPLSRRALLGGASGAALAASVWPVGDVHAAEKQFENVKIVFGSWGGSYQDSQKQAFCIPFAQKTGATVTQDGPVDYAKLRIMLAAPVSAWDVVDVAIDFLYSTADDGVYAKIDKSIVDVSRVDAKYVHEYAVGDIVWSYNLGYSLTAFTEESRPRSWTDMFDLKKFAGRRMLPDRVGPTLEIALMADGVSPDKLYPLDVDRAFKKLDTIKSQTVFWTTNSQSQQLLVDGEVSMGVIINGRVYDAVNKGGKLGIEWNQHINSVDYLVVPRKSKNIAAAMALINEMTTPEAQGKVANLMALAPTNTAAFAFIDDKVKPWLSTNPDYANNGMLLNAAYWRDNLKPLSNRWTQWKLS